MDYSKTLALALDGRLTGANAQFYCSTCADEEMNVQLNMSSITQTLRAILFALVFIFAMIEISLAASTDEGVTPAFEIAEGLDSYCDGQTADDSESLSQKQFKTAEIADAVLGTELFENRARIEALIPKSLISTPCEKEVTEEVKEKDAGKEEVAVIEEEVEIEMKQESPAGGEEQNSTETAKTYKVSCDKRSITGLDTFTVQVLNSSQDLMDFLNSNSSECSLVLFYTSWCQFSAHLAPHFNALPRVFPIMHFLALDASQHSSLSTRFGTVAVPNILLFQGTKPMARFNHTERTLETLIAFITNQTGKRLALTKVFNTYLSTSPQNCTVCITYTTREVGAQFISAYRLTSRFANLLAWYLVACYQ